MSFPRLNKAFGPSIGGINEDDVARIATGRVDRNHKQRMFDGVGHTVYGAFLEEQHLARSHFEGLLVSHEEPSASGENDQIFIACRVIMGRGWTVDAKDTRARLVLVSQSVIYQQRICFFGKRSDYIVQFEGSVRGSLHEFLACSIIDHPGVLYSAARG